MDRQHFAFLIIVLVALAAVLFGAHRWHNSRERTYLRRRRKEAASYDRHMAERGETTRD